MAMFAAQIDRAERLTLDRVAEYGLEAVELSEIKRRFREWVDLLRQDPTGNGHRGDR